MWFSEERGGAYCHNKTKGFTNFMKLFLTITLFLSPLLCADKPPVQTVENKELTRLTAEVKMLRAKLSWTQQELAIWQNIGVIQIRLEALKAEQEYLKIMDEEKKSSSTPAK